MSAAAAFQYHWPFGDELCVAYAMIMSTAGCAFLFIVILNPNVIRVNNHIFHIGVNIWGYWNLKKKKRNRIDHNIDGVGVVAMSTCRLLSGQTERSFRQSSQQRQWRRQQRQTGPSSGHNFIDSHLDLFVGRHLSAAFRMGTLRSWSCSHQVNNFLTDSIEISFLVRSIQVKRKWIQVEIHFPLLAGKFWII